MHHQETEPLLSPIKRRQPTKYSNSLSLPYLTRPNSLPISTLENPRSSYEDADEVQDHGIHFKYEDYSTIDFAHDIIKDRIRYRNLAHQSIYVRCWDAMQAWIVLVIVGVSAGLIASGIDVVIPYLFSWREGFCRNGFHEISGCREWVKWRDIVGPVYGFLIYVLISLLYAKASVVIVSHGPTHKLRDTRFVATDLDREFLSQRTLYHAAGSGIPEVKTILGGFVIKRFLGLRTLVFKIIALILSVSSGLCLGVQGPLVHISCCLGNVFSRFFEKYERNDAKKREIMSAACAAGVSVAFGAPIGGVLFSLEETSYYFPPKTMWRSFFCALIAAVCLKFVNPLGSGKLVLFQVNYGTEFHTFEIIGFVIIGILGGLMGAGFIKLSRKLRALISTFKVKYFAIYEVLLISLLTSISSYSSEFTMMNNIELVSELFMECVEGSQLAICNLKMDRLLPTLILAVTVKWSLMVLTFGTRVPGGLFLPNMLVGALIGRIIGEVVKSMLPTYYIIPGVYAMVGAAALLSGTHRMTVSLIVIMFELTGNLSYVLPLMTAVMVAKWVADAISRDSIFDSVIVQKGYPYLNFKNQRLTSTMLIAKDLMDSTADTIDCEMMYRYSDLLSMLDTMSQTHPAGDGGFPVLKHGKTLVGYISQNDLERALEKTLDHEHLLITFSGVNEGLTEASPEIMEAIVQDFSANTHLYDFSQFVNKAPISLESQSSAELVVELFMKLGIRTLLIICEGVYVGIIHKKQLLYLLAKSEANSR